MALELEPLIAARAKENYDANVGRPNKSSQKSDTIKIDTKKELASVAGVSHDTIHKAKVISAKAPEDVKAKLRSGEVSINAAYRDVKKVEHPRQFAEQWKPLTEILSAAAETLCQVAEGIANTSAERRVVLAELGRAAR